MAVNKNFVVKNGLEVNDDLILANPTNSRVGIGTSVPQYTLHAFGGIGATSLHVAGVSTFLSDVRITGVTTLASAGGITTTGGDFYVGGDLYVLDDVVYDEVSGRNLNITGVGTINRLDVSKDINVTGVGTITRLNTTDIVSTSSTITRLTNTDFVGTSATITRVNTTNLVGTAGTFTIFNTTGIGTVGILSATHAVVSGAATVVGTLTVGGDLNVTGDLSYDEVTGRNLNITGVATITRLNTTNLVGTISTITRLNWTDAVGTSATITTLSGTTATFTTINATSITGAAQIGVASEGTFLGSGASMINFASSNGTAWTVEPAGTSGIATVTVTPGASIGLAIALGG